MAENFTNMYLIVPSFVGGLAGNGGAGQVGGQGQPLKTIRKESRLKTVQLVLQR